MHSFVVTMSSTSPASEPFTDDSFSDLLWQPIKGRIDAVRKARDYLKDRRVPIRGFQVVRSGYGSSNT